MATDEAVDWSIWCETCQVQLATGKGPRPSAEAVLAENPDPSIRQHTEAVNQPGVVHRFTVRGRVTESIRIT
jgi:hypothetical protein